MGLGGSSGGNSVRSKYPMELLEDGHHPVMPLMINSGGQASLESLLNALSENSDYNNENEDSDGSDAGSWRSAESSFDDRDEFRVAPQVSSSC